MNTLSFQLFTLFPEMFPGSLGHSLAGKALEKGIWSYETVNIRDYALDKHKSVDDTICGGGTGLVMRPDVLGNALDSAWNGTTRLIYPSPRGKRFSQSMAYDLVESGQIALLCGRFEGIDERILEAYPLEEVSLGDYILSGGEVAALTVMDACIRLLPGVIGKKEALEEESFTSHADFAGLLEYPLYTKPAEWKGRAVPDVLLSGNHAAIHRWRLKQAEALTASRRPDLWEAYTKQKNS